MFRVAKVKRLANRVLDQTKNILSNILSSLYFDELFAYINLIMISFKRICVLIKYRYELLENLRIINS